MSVTAAQGGHCHPSHLLDDAYSIKSNLPRGHAALDALLQHIFIVPLTRCELHLKCWGDSGDEMERAPAPLEFVF